MDDKPAKWEIGFGVVGVVGALVISGRLTDFYDVTATRGHAGLIVLCGFVLAVPAFVIFAIWRVDGLKRAGWILAPVLAFGFLFVFHGWNRYDWRTNYVLNPMAAYCAYGSTSRAQQEGCLNHVTYADLDRKTRAARFAYNSLASCGATAGPYCEDVVNARKEQYAFSDMLDSAQ